MGQKASSGNIYRVAIIGAGPSAFYASNALLKQHVVPVAVDIFEKLPTPYGLVRGGVAPDHQNIKAVTKIYERTAKQKRFRFFGNITFGEDLRKADLQKHYDAILYATGCSTDRHLNIEGEALEGSHSATEFVGWYNGHPEYQSCQFDLSTERAVIVGMGNVAMDVARVLLHTPEELASTDITENALNALKKSKIREVCLVGRRGPVQAAFTPIELREMFFHLEDAQLTINPDDLILEPINQEELEQASRQIHQNLELLQQIQELSPSNKSKNLRIIFKHSPAKILGEAGRVTGIQLAQNSLIRNENGKITTQRTGHIETLDAGLVFRSIGYFGKKLPDVVFDTQKGIIPNKEGRVLDPQTGNLQTGEYVTGWAKRGPHGVIGTNKHDAIETVTHLLDDLQTNQLAHPAVDDQAILHFMQGKHIEMVTFNDWKILDTFEQTEGQKKGKVREKVVTKEAMLEVIHEGNHVTKHS